MRKPPGITGDASARAMSRLGEWLSRNALLIGLLGSIASLISIPLAIYFFQKSSRDRQLTYVVNPARAVVVSQARARGSKFCLTIARSIQT